MSSPLFRILCPGCSTELQVVQHQQQGFAFAILEQMNQAGIECKNDPCPVYIEGGGEENADETKNVDEEEKKEQEKTVSIPPLSPPYASSIPQQLASWLTFQFLAGTQDTALPYQLG